MELVPVINTKNAVVTEENERNETTAVANNAVSNVTRSPILEANTQEITVKDLHSNCIIPVFAKDNERTISHHEFIEVVHSATSHVLHGEQLADTEVRVSHPIKGRIPSSMHKPAKELLEHEKTQYFQRMAFAIEVPSITSSIGSNPLNLTVGGVRAYNHDNLSAKKGMEKFKVFVGFKNMVCCNLCISTDGYQGELKATSAEELWKQVVRLIREFQAQELLQQMLEMQQLQLTESQMAHFVGKMRMYNYLPKRAKQGLPEIKFGDTHFNLMAKDYYHNKSFCRGEDGSINLWNLYNLFTGANKSSYIDTFLDRGVNAMDIVTGISKALIFKDSRYSWFIP